MRVFTWDDKPLSVRQIRERAEKLARMGANAIITFGTHFLLAELARQRFDRTRDRLGEVVQSCHACGIRVIEHRSAAALPADVVDELRQGKDFPLRQTRLRDILQVSAPNPLTGETRPVIQMVCPNHPGYQELYASVILELAATGIDGLMSDDVQYCDWLCCVCEHCQRKFKRETGHEIPLRNRSWWGDFNHPLWREWLLFRLRSTGDHHQRVTNRLQKKGYHLARLACCSNLTGTWSAQGAAFSYEEYIRGCNVVFQEVTKYTAPFYSWERKEAETKVFSALAVKAGVPSLAMFYPRSRSEYFFCWALAKALGQRYWGCSRRVIKGCVVTSEAKRSQGLARWEGKHEELFDRPKSLAEIGVFFSARTRYLYRGMDDDFHTNEFAGWGEVLAANHLLYNVVLDGDVEDGNLDRYQLLILPSVACLSPKQVRNLRRYVEQGGRLIVTHEASLYTAKGKRLPNFQLADLLGVRYLNTITDSHLPLVLTEKGTSVLGNLGPRLANLSPHALVMPEKDGEVLATILRTDPTHRFPAIFSRPVGRGEIVYVSCKPGCLAVRPEISVEAAGNPENLLRIGETLPVFRRLMSGLVKSLLKKTARQFEMISESPGWYVSAYETARSKPRTVVHLLNVQGARAESGEKISAHWRAHFPQTENGKIVFRVKGRKSGSATVHVPSTGKQYPIAPQSDSQHGHRLEIPTRWVRDYAIVEIA